VTAAAAIEELIVAEVAAAAYHPRTSKHSDSQSFVIVRDLPASCMLMRERASTGELVAKLRHHQQVGHADWVIDIALGTPAGEARPPDQRETICWTEPALIQVAIELKSIWTEHGKTRRNRLRDFNSFHGYAHDYHPKTIAAAFLVVNAAEFFLSPLNLGRTKGEITWHRRPSKSAAQLAKETIDLFRSIHLRNNENDVAGLEGLGVVVIEHDNMNYLAGKPEHADLAAKYQALARPSRPSESPPALRVGDPLHYTTMIQRICNAYTDRCR
jgi:hypothetical protein